MLPVSALLRIPGPAGYLKTEQGLSCYRYRKGFLVVSPDCHIRFGYVFYYDMNKKPVAQSQNQHYLLGFRTVHGLLSRLWTAIVVDCFIPVVGRAVGQPACAATPPGYTLFREFEVRDV